MDFAPNRPHRHPRLAMTIITVTALVLAAETILALLAAVGFIASMVTIYGISMWWFSALFPTWAGVIWLSVICGQMLDEFTI